LTASLVLLLLLLLLLLVPFLLSLLLLLILLLPLLLLLILLCHDLFLLFIVSPPFAFQAAFFLNGSLRTTLTPAIVPVTALLTLSPVSAPIA